MDIFLETKKIYSQDWRCQLLHERRAPFTGIHWVPIIVCLWPKWKMLHTQDYYYESKSSYLLPTQKINFLITKSADKHKKYLIPSSVYTIECWRKKTSLQLEHIFILLFEITESKTWLWFSFTLSLYCTML